MNIISILALIGLAVVAYAILGIGLGAIPMLLRLVIYGVGILAIIYLGMELLRRLKAKV